MTRSKAKLSVLAFVLASAPSAIAGIVDDPVPPLQGQSARHVYSVPDVINNGNLSTYFACTNVDGGDVIVGVEVYGPSGIGAFNDVSATSQIIPASATKIFGTTTAAGLTIDQHLTTGAFPLGSARIVATSSRILCTAFLMDGNNTIPTSGWQLTIVAKTKQKAAN